MIVFAIIVAAAACVAVAWLTGTVAFAYVALGVCAIGLGVIAVNAWQNSGSAAGAQEKDGGTLAEADRVDDEEPEVSDPEVSDPEMAVVEQAPADVAGKSTEPAEMVVYVVPGRKRFHRTGCRLLADHEHEPLTVVEALEEGFTACSVCGAKTDNPAAKSA